MESKIFSEAWNRSCIYILIYADIDRSAVRTVCECQSEI